MTSSEEPLRQFQPNLVGNMLGGRGIKGLANLGPNKVQNTEKIW